MSNIIEFLPPMPQPTLENPHAQVSWIFKEKMSLYENKHTRYNFSTALAFYKSFLEETNNYNPLLEGDPRFYIKDEWDVMALHKVKQWIDATNIAGTENYLTSNTLSNHISAIRRTMEYAYEHNYIRQPVIKVFMPSAVRETLQRAAFSNNEYTAIFNAISPLIQFSRGLVRPYCRTGKGRDPRKGCKAGVPRGERPLGQGWTCWARTSNSDGFVISDDNMRWYFENVMDCLPLPATPENKKHMKFFWSAAVIYGGLNNLYKKWGVSSRIGADEIMPLMIKLISETGLNVESLLSLKRDCFKEAHPLTGLPYIEYNKPRSGGEKELHIMLFDKAEDGLMALGQRQSQIIGKTIKLILELTEPLVKLAPEKARSYLVLCQCGGQSNFCKVQRVNKKIGS